jgi:uncharacterized protein (DUF2147 family)
MKKAIILATFIALTTYAYSQVNIAGKDCVGVWKTIDDETGRAKSHVKIWEYNGKYYGKIVKLLDPEILKENGVDDYSEVLCDECPEDRGKNEPVLGLKMIWGMEKDDDEWDSGKILDPKTGRVYGCSMWLDEDDPQGDTLKVRGWLAFFYRTQTWYRVD